MATPTTIGRIMINEALPEELRDDNRVYDGKAIRALYSEIAEKHPEIYADINRKLNKLSLEFVGTHGGTASLSLKDLELDEKTSAKRELLRKKIKEITDAPGSVASKKDQIIKLLGSSIGDMSKSVYDEGVLRDNAFAHQALSGARGNKSQLMSLLAGDMLVMDQKDRPIPLPITNSYSEGLDPVQYFAAAYGARRGAISTKYSTPKAGFLGKQLFQAAHRLVVTENDCGTKNGILVDGDDEDNEGAVLAHPVGGFAAGTVLTPKHLQALAGKKIAVRSSISCNAENGLCRLCAGKRERGDFPPLHDNVGAAASNAASEPLSQAMLSEKHTGGVVTGKPKTSKGGLDLINQLVQVPATFPNAAALAQVDGAVSKIENAPQGGKFIYVGNERHWVAPDAELKIKIGDKLEAGDSLSSGIINPAEIVKYKGIGEGRRVFMQQLRETFNELGIPVHRRNLELISRGLINHVRVTDIDGPEDTVPDDVVEYDRIVRGYQPRHGMQRVAPKRGLGLYLEEPRMQYSIGTRITPKVVTELEQQGIIEITAHKEPPSFQPEMVRAMETLSHTDDWMVGLGGFHLKKSLLSAAHRGSESKTHGTSFIPALAQGKEFGEGKGPY